MKVRDDSAQGFRHSRIRPSFSLPVLDDIAASPIVRHTGEGETVVVHVTRPATVALSVGHKSSRVDEEAQSGPK